MDILLISLHRGQLTNFGLRYISSCLKQGRHKAEILFLPKRTDENEFGVIESFIGQKSPKLLGLSLMSPNFPFACKLTKRIKTILPETLIVWGGTHPTIASEECIPYTDAVCIGEGEMPMLELANCMENNENYLNVRNFLFHIDDKTIKNPTRPFFEPLDALPFPDWSINSHFVMEDGKIKLITEEVFRRYMHYEGATYNIEITRGCPNSCTYCSNSILRRVASGHYVRRRSPENVLVELNEAVKNFPFIKAINFQDDCILAVGQEWLDRFTPRYKKEINLPFLARVIPIFVTEENILSLVEMGMEFVGMGLQSGSKRIIKEVYKRNSTPEEFIRAARILEKHPLLKNYDVITNNPYETEEDIIETLKVLAQLKKPFNLNIYSLTPYPGTPFYERAAEDGHLDKLNDPYDEEISFSYVFPKSPMEIHLHNLFRLTTFMPGWLILFLVRFRNPLTFKISKSLISIRKYILRILDHLGKTRPDLFLKILRVIKKLKF
ncbi:MAG: radical SAM protein [bacterium]